MMLADAEPVTVRPVVTSDASRFSKFRMFDELPTVWSAPAATEKSTAVTDAPVATTSVSRPPPPSIEASVPRNVTVSFPAPASMISAPPTPSMVSLPLPPIMVLVPAEPVSEMPDDSADASTFWKPVTETASPLVWSMLPRLTVVTARNTSVLVPVPPSIETSEL